jgi:hypothetical protein
MSTVYRSLHRWWVLLIAIAGSTLATADATARVGDKTACGNQTSLTRLTDHSAMAYVAVDCSAARKSDRVLNPIPSRVAPDRQTDRTGSFRFSTVLPGKRSRPRLDAEVWDDRTADDDDTDVPVKAWLRDMVRGTDMIPVGSHFPSDLIRTLWIFSPSYQRLRC